MKFKDFIEDNFVIDDMETSQMVPFKLRPVQERYYQQLCNDYGEETNFKGAREIILKARKEGFTSFILALFMASLILSEHPVRYVELSYKDEATRQHFRRAKEYIMSYYRKKTGIKDDTKLEKLIFKSIVDGNEMILNHNGASFYVSTASAKTGERGGNLNGVLFSEEAHYGDTERMSASEIIEGTANQVPVDAGWIFKETTANGNNHFRNSWNMAMNKETSYKPRFFGWRDFYSEAQFERIKLSFNDKSKIPQEYPETWEEAFLTVESPVFNIDALTWYKKSSGWIKNPLFIGNCIGVKDVTFDEDPSGKLKIWKLPERSNYYVMGADPCEGRAKGDFACAQILDKNLEQVASWYGTLEPDVFAKELYKIGMFYNQATIGVERNSIGVASVIVLRDLFYPNLYVSESIGSMVDTSRQDYGWHTNVKTKAIMISDMQELIRNKLIMLHDEMTWNEMFSFSYNERGTASALSGSHDDRCMSAMLAYQMYKRNPSGATTSSNQIMGGGKSTPSAENSLMNEGEDSNEYM